jgi:Domain of unknown function (DUF4345)
MPADLARRGSITEVRLLQIAVAVAALVPITAGLAGIFGGPPVFGPEARGVSLDSHVRYLSGLLLGIGLAFWSFIPRITRVTREVRLLTGLVLLGGLARLLSLVVAGAPSAGMMFGLVMELVVTPALCVWQGRIARIAASAAQL